MGARAHHYLLLLLARRRLADRAAGNPESACGWIHQEEWDHDPSLASSRVNLDVCRSRMQFSKLGVLDARNIVERRPRSRQLRLGVARLSVIRV
ncbi:MAG: hypothetical protein JOZ69_21460 [Myxococcales bacterium]|nr:hypothetical protein [Myxococcales bacterium]